MAKFTTWFVIEWCNECRDDEDGDPTEQYFSDEMEWLIIASSCRKCKSYKTRLANIDA